MKAYVGGIDRAVYAASKHAVEGMIKSMAIEWGDRGIRINSVCPSTTFHSRDVISTPNRKRIDRWCGERMTMVDLNLKAFVNQMSF